MCTRIQSFLNTASYWSAAFPCHWTYRKHVSRSEKPPLQSSKLEAHRPNLVPRWFCLMRFFQELDLEALTDPWAIWVCYSWVRWLHCELLLFLFISISEHFFWDLAPTDLSLLSRTLFLCAAHFDIPGDHHPNRLMGQPKWLRKALHISKSLTPRQQFLPPVENHCIKSMPPCFKTDTFFWLFILNYSASTSFHRFHILQTSYQPNDTLYLCEDQA